MKYLGFVLLVLSGYVMAEEVYYCSDNTNGANGFKKNKQTGQYERQGFLGEKFKMKLQDDGDIAISNDAYTWSYLCSTPYSVIPKFKNKKSCVSEHHSGLLFNFNPDNGRYILFKGFGYVFDDFETVPVETHIGTCTKF